VSNARRENAIVVTGDPEFRNVEHIVEIEWLGKFFIDAPKEKPPQCHI